MVKELIHHRVSNSDLRVTHDIHIEVKSPLQEELKRQARCGVFFKREKLCDVDDSLPEGYDNRIIFVRTRDGLEFQCLGENLQAFLGKHN